MSNSLAIATVTAALADVINLSIAALGNSVKVHLGRPPTNVQASDYGVYLCLYQVMPNAALRNADLPTRTGAGEVRQKPQVALDLHYLLAFYGDETTLEPERMLGVVTRDLHAKPVLEPNQLKAVTAPTSAWYTVLENSDLHQAIERVKLTQLALSLEDLSKLWSVFFQTPHALSIAYHASVVLIEAEDAATPAPPVLRRGEEDRGVDTFLGGFPQLESIHISFPDDVTAPEPFPSIPNAWLGLSLVIKGKDLAGDSVNIRFNHPLLPALIVSIAATDRSATAIHFTLPNDAQAQDDWAAGLYSLTVEVVQGAKSRSTNQLGFNLAAKITNITPPNPLPRVGTTAALQLTVSPKIRPTQTPILLLANLQAAAEPIAQASNLLDVNIDDARTLPLTPVYLRVDGVDSLPIERLANPRRLAFDDNQKVAIQ